MASAIKDAFGWSSDSFIPEDPFELMVLADDGVSTEVMDAVADHLNIPRRTISDKQYEVLLALTFGQVVDELIRIADAYSKETR